MYQSWLSLQLLQTTGNLDNKFKYNARNNWTVLIYRDLNLNNCQTPVLGLGLGVDFTFAWDKKNKNNDNDNNDNNNPHH